MQKIIRSSNNATKSQRFISIYKYISTIFSKLWKLQFNWIILTVFQLSLTSQTNLCLRVWEGLEPWFLWSRFHLLNLVKKRKFLISLRLDSNQKSSKATHQPRHHPTNNNACHMFLNTSCSIKFFLNFMFFFTKFFYV